MTHTTKISLENLLQRRLKKLHTKLDRGIHMRSRLEQGARGSCLHLTHGVGSTATARIDPDASHLGHIAAHASTMTVTGVTAGMRVSLARPVHRGVDRRLGRTSDHRGRSARASVKPLHPPPHARVDFRLRDDGKLFFLEANPNPDIHESDEFASAAKAAGLNYGELLQKLLTLGMSYQP